MGEAIQASVDALDVRTRNSMRMHPFNRLFVRPPRICARRVFFILPPPCQLNTSELENST